MCWKKASAIHAENDHRSGLIDCEVQVMEFLLFSSLELRLNFPDVLHVQRTGETEYAAAAPH